MQLGLDVHGEATQTCCEWTCDMLYANRSEDNIFQSWKGVTLHSVLNNSFIWKLPNMLHFSKNKNPITHSLAASKVGNIPCLHIKKYKRDVLIFLFHIVIILLE